VLTAESIRSGSLRDIENIGSNFRYNTTYISKKFDYFGSKSLRGITFSQEKMNLKYRCAVLSLFLSQVTVALAFSQRFLFHLQIDKFSVVTTQELKKLRIGLDFVVYLFYIRFGLIGTYILVSCAQLSRKSTRAWYVALVAVGILVDISVSLALALQGEVFTKRTEYKWYAKTIEGTFVYTLILLVFLNVPLVYTLASSILKPDRRIIPEHATNETTQEHQTRNQSLSGDENFSFNHETYNPDYNPLNIQGQDFRLSSVSSAPALVNTEEVALEIYAGPPPPYRP